MFKHIEFKCKNLDAKLKVLSSRELRNYLLSYAVLCP